MNSIFTTDECKEILGAFAKNKAALICESGVPDEDQIEIASEDDLQALRDLLNGPDDGHATIFGFDWNIEDIRRILCQDPSNSDFCCMNLSDMILLRRMNARRNG